jgi:CelD/BcsL family acetyltransferase involved in cellulose biosynthesis
MTDIEIIRTDEDWANLAEPWNLLLSRSIMDVPFLRHEFLYAWWQHRGGGEWKSDELYILTRRSPDGELTGALPLFLSKNHAGKTALVLLGSIEIADNLDLLATPEDLEDFTDAALSHLTGEAAPSWEVIEFYNLLEDSPSLAALEKAAQKHGLAFSQERLQPSPYIPMPESFDAYLENLDGRYRREMVRKMRNALRYFIPVEVVGVEEEDDLSAEMEDFFTMMREEPEKDRFLTDVMVDQMQAVAQAAAEHDWLDLRFLIVGREKAAGYLNFIYDNKVWVYNSALAKKFGSLSPGVALIGMLIEEAIEKGYTEFDLLRGDEDYKYHLGGQDRWVVKAVVSK